METLIDTKRQQIQCQSPEKLNESISNLIQNSPEKERSLVESPDLLPRGQYLMRAGSPSPMPMQVLEQSSFLADSVPDESEQILDQDAEGESLQIDITEADSSFALLSSPVTKEGRLARQLDFLARLESITSTF